MKSKLPLWRNIAVICAVLLVLGGGFWFVYNYQPDSAEDSDAAQSTKNPQYSVYKADKENVSEFEVRTADSTLTAVQTETDKWSLNGISADELDSSKITSLVDTALTVISNYEIEKSPSDLSKYGLSEPYMTITVTNKDGTADKLYVGDQSPVTSEYFFIVDGADTVYSIYNYKVDTLLKPLSYYQSFNRFSVNADNISEIVMKRPKNTVHLKIKDAASTTYNVWEISEPYDRTYSAIDQYIDENILPAISSLSVSDKAAEGKNYGLDNPAAELVLTVTDYNDDGSKGDSYTKTVKIGNTEGGLTYVSLDDSPAVYTVSEDSLAFVYTDEFLLLSKLQAMVDIQNTDKVTVSSGGVDSVLDITHVDEKTFEFKIDGTDADEKKSKQMYQDIIALYVDGMYAGEPLGEPQVTISYRGYGGGEDTVMEFIPINELSYALRKNGEVQFTIKKSKVREMLDKLEEFKQNPNG